MTPEERAVIDNALYVHGVIDAISVQSTYHPLRNLHDAVVALKRARIKSEYVRLFPPVPAPPPMPAPPPAPPPRRVPDEWNAMAAKAVADEVRILTDLVAPLREANALVPDLARGLSDAIADLLAKKPIPPDDWE